MNIFAAIKKAINSNLDKPLNITLDEIKTSVDNVRKATRHMGKVVGIPYNTTTDRQVLNASDAPILSVNGSGRIIQVIPIFFGSPSSAVKGTALISVDDTIIVNTNARFATTSNTYEGYCLIDYTDNRSVARVYSDLSGSVQGYYINNPVHYLGDATNFVNMTGGIIAPNGVPFKNNFELRLTQAVSTSSNTLGVIVVYELYE